MKNSGKLTHNRSQVRLHITILFLNTILNPLFVTSERKNFILSLILILSLVGFNDASTL